MTQSVKEVEIIPIKPRDGLIAFASLVLGDWLYLSSIGVHTKLDGSGVRLSYPTKKVGERNINIFHPINHQAAEVIEKAVAQKLREMGLP